MRPLVWGQRRRFPRPLGIALTLAAILLLGAAIEILRPHAEPVTGRAEIVDGDTLRFGALRVRLTGLDAPELDQTCTDRAGAEWACGSEAKTFVAGLIASEPVSCVRSGRDRYGRALATCSIDGRDLGSQIVAAGWAVAELDYAAMSLPRGSPSAASGAAVSCRRPSGGAPTAAPGRAFGNGSEAGSSKRGAKP